MGRINLIQRTRSGLGHSICNNELLCPFIPRNDGTFEWFRMAKNESAICISRDPGVKQYARDDCFRIFVLTLLFLTILPILNTENRE
jgi:hypothetical protein